MLFCRAFHREWPAVEIVGGLEKAGDDGNQCVGTYEKVCCRCYFVRNDDHVGEATCMGLGGVGVKDGDI